MPGIAQKYFQNDITRIIVDNNLLYICIYNVKLTSLSHLRHISLIPLKIDTWIWKLSLIDLNITPPNFGTLNLNWNTQKSLEYIKFELFYFFFLKPLLDAKISTTSWRGKARGRWAYLFSLLSLEISKDSFGKLS